MIDISIIIINKTGFNVNSIISIVYFFMLMQILSVEIISISFQCLQNKQC